MPEHTLRLNRAELATRLSAMGIELPSLTSPAKSSTPAEKSSPRIASEISAPPMPRDPEQPPVPVEYEHVTELARGGMATVHLARRVATGEQVALKIMSAEAAEMPMIRARFAREIELLRKLAHPHIIELVGADPKPARGRPWLALEFCPNGSLRDVLRNSPMGFAPARALEIVVQVGSALACLHEHAIVHRDLKPGNVLLTASGSAKLADLGIAHTTKTSDSDVTLTNTGDVLGTRGYFAPEQLAGTAGADPRIDIWALGGLTWELLTGLPPVDPAKLGSHALGDRSAGLGSELFEAIRWAREPDPGCRCPNVRAFLERLPV